MKTITKGGSGSTNKGASKKLAGNAKRPPKLKGRVANDVAPTARSAVMPPPTTDTNYTKKSSGGKYGR